MKAVALAAVAVTVASSGCRTTSKSRANEVREQIALQTIEAGDWLITFQRAEECTVGELLLAKKYSYVPGGDQLDRIVVKATELVGDNVVRAAVCRPGTSKGVMHLKVDAPTKLQAEGLETSAVTPVKTSAVAMPAAGAELMLTTGKYLVQAQGFDGCNGNSEMNVAKSYEVSFDEATPNVALIGNAGLVLDNRVRLPNCVQGPLAGETYLEVARPTVVRAREGVTITGAQKIEE